MGAKVLRKSGVVTISFRKMRRPVRPALLCAALLGCGGLKPAPNLVPDPDAHPLAQYIGQQLIIAPVQSVRPAPELEWTVPSPRATISALDSVLADTLRARLGNVNSWIFADGLVKAAANNPTYATDPRALTVLSLRSPALKVDDRLVEPLATQLRTMIALQEARMVLIPVELRFDRTPAGLGRPMVRLVLVDPRASVVRWIAEVPGTDQVSFTPSYSASLATRFADLFAGR
jgi:hypothetical protein